MFPFKSAAKITVSISSTNACSFALFESPELKMSLKAWRFLFTASLLLLLIHQSAQEECVCMLIFVYVLELLSNWLHGLVACPMQSKREAGLRLWVIIFSPLHSFKSKPNLKKWPAHPRSLSLLCQHPINHAKPAASKKHKKHAWSTHLNMDIYVGISWTQFDAICCSITNFGVTRKGR